MTPQAIRSTAALCGIALIGLGLGSYDWRAGLIAVGVIVLALSVVGTWHAQGAVGD